MAQIFLMLGSNSGERKKNLEDACFLLQENTGIIIKKSHIFETEPWGYDDNNFYLNQAVELKTSCNPWVLLSKTKNIEFQLGRIRGSERYASRTIDIDILFYDKLVVKSAELIIPHPEIPNRRFVLESLAEIAPGWEHPTLGKSILELLKECEDQKKVTEFKI